MEVRMGYKVFISHSTRDQRLVISLANLLTKFDIDVSVAEWYLTPGQRIEEKVFNEIGKSNCVVILLTQNGMRSAWVQQEIGYALNTKRPVIPLVETGINAKDLGALQGREYIEYDPNWPQQALNNLSTSIRSLKLKKEDQEQALLVAVGILAFLLLLSNTQSRE